jgi:hypothetical protein
MKIILGIIASLLAIFAVMTMPAVIRAASIADNIGGTIQSGATETGGNNITTSSSTSISSSGAGAGALATSGTTEQAPNGGSIAKTLVLTAVAEKPFVKAGDKQIIHVRTAMDNGTGIPDVTIQALTQEYNATNQKVLLGGQTDAKGNLDLTVTTGPHAKAGQFLIIANAAKGDLKSSVASGFAVTESGSGAGSSSSSSSSSSGGKCSGSSCK